MGDHERVTVSALIVTVVLEFLILTFGIKVGCLFIAHKLSWQNAMAISAVTVGVGLIPVVGPIAGTVALLGGLVTIGELEFWPDSILVAIIMKIATLAIVFCLNSEMLAKLAGH